MGTRQSQSGHGRRGSRQQSQQSDRRPQQERDLQRIKQSDSGQREQQGAERERLAARRRQIHQGGGSPSQQGSGGLTRQQSQGAPTLKGERGLSRQDQSEVGHRFQAGVGMSRDEYRESPARQGAESAPLGREGSVQQSQQGGGKQIGHKQQNEGRQQSQQESKLREPIHEGGETRRQQNVYGEGNYAASRQYNEATKKFAQSGRVESAARAAEPKSDADASQMAAAEAEGKRHAKGEDPALNRKASEQPPESRTPRPGEEEE